MKKKNNGVKLFWSIIKRCHFDKLLIIFLICFFISALLFLFLEPGITNFGDALWYSFVCCTTIGFGDFAAVTILGRIITVVLTIYEIVLVAILSGVVVSHYLEVVNRREKFLASRFKDKLEHLTELSKEELLEIQENVKAFSSSEERKQQLRQ